MERDVDERVAALLPMTVKPAAEAARRDKMTTFMVNLDLCLLCDEDFGIFNFFYTQHVTDL